MNVGRVLAAAIALSALVLPALADEASNPSLTIYNQQFAVVRNTIPLNLTGDVTSISFTGITSHLEPDSVILRDPTGETNLRILEQNYRGDVASQDLLLSLYEGKTIDFQTVGPNGTPGPIVQGKIIRSGYIPQSDLSSSYNPYYQPQYNGSGASNQPLIEVNGRLQFSLPGTPLFPQLTDDSILKPTLEWSIASDKPGPVNAELAYVTGGMSWKAAYNVVAPDTGTKLDLTGWVTIENQSGLDFPSARIKLMAGDVSKIQQNGQYGNFDAVSMSQNPGTPQVTQKAFDDYHLYTLPLPTTLRDRETKQVEFVRASNVDSDTIYTYDGLQIDQSQYSGWGYDNIRNRREYGTESNPKVAVVREFKNSADNNLGVPLPAGRVRFYRKDTDGQLEFLGEQDIDHTPKDEIIRVTTGNAFDLVGSRTQTDYKIDTQTDTLDESFSIVVKNHKAEPVDVRVIEHLYRALSWDIRNNSDPFVKKDSRTIEFRVQIPPDGEKTVTYSVHYTW